MQRVLWGKRPGLFVRNSRFYILAAAVCVSITILCFFRTQYVSDGLFLIRVQQIFGFIALGLWYLALLATPLSVVLGKQGAMQQYLYARRALGVAAAYYAVLHMGFGIFGQLGGLSGLTLLPEAFQQALIFGLVGLITLLAMAATSFDKAIRFLTFPRWKWLHRFGYVAAVFVFLHVWIIGTHMESTTIRLIAGLLLSFLLVLESWRASLQIEKLSGDKDLRTRVLIFLSLSVLFVGVVAYVPQTVNRFHGGHTGGSHHR